MRSLARIITLLIAMLFVGCSGSTPRYTHTLDDPHRSGALLFGPLRCTKNESFFRCLAPEGGELFFTSISDCRENAKPVNLAGSARRLFAGAHFLEVSAPKEVELLGARAMRFEGELEYESEPLSMVSISRVHNGCTTDYVFWKVADPRGESGLQQLQTVVMSSLPDIASTLGGASR